MCEMACQKWQLSCSTFANGAYYVNHCRWCTGRLLKVNSKQETRLQKVFQIELLFWSRSWYWFWFWSQFSQIVVKRSSRIWNPGSWVRIMLPSPDGAVPKGRTRWFRMILHATNMVCLHTTSESQSESQSGPVPLVHQCLLDLKRGTTFGLPSHW